MSDPAWTTKYRGLEVVLRQRGRNEFRVQVGDGVLTYFYPVRDCDFNTATLRAYDRAVQFARLRLPAAGNDPVPVEALEWEPLADAKPSVFRDQPVSATI